MTRYLLMILSVILLSSCGANKAMKAADVTGALLGSYTEQIGAVNKADGKFAAEGAELIAADERNILGYQANAESDSKRFKYLQEVDHANGNVLPADLYLLLDASVSESIEAARADRELYEERAAAIASQQHKNELAQKDLELVRARLGYLSARENIPDQVIFYLTFASKVESYVQQKRQEAAATPGPAAPLNSTN